MIAERDDRNNAGAIGRVADGKRCFEAALAYRLTGWLVLALCPPDHAGMSAKHREKCNSPGKSPWHLWKKYQDKPPTEAEVRAWFKEHPLSNVGMALGALVRIDIDGPAAEEELKRLSRGDLPNTLEFTTGSPGKRGILYLAPVGVAIKTTPKPGGASLAGGELRFQAKGAQTVLPPSRHESGRLYEWVEGHGPDDLEAAPAPGWLVELMMKDTPKASKAKVAGTAGVTVEGQRNTELTSLAGRLRRDGLDVEAIAAALQEVNRSRCQPPLAEEEVKTIAASIGRYPPGSPAGAGPYAVAGGRIVRFDRESNVVPLANFDARIVGQTTIDDGAERRTVLEVEGALSGGTPLPRVEVPAGDFGSLGWVVPAWGARAVVYAGQGTKDHVRAALQLLSGDTPTRTVYGHAGWREINGRWCYLHAGGAIGQDGAVGGAEVQLPDALSAFTLPDPVEGQQVAEAVHASLRVLDLAPDKITAPLLAAVFRAVLAPADFALHLAGATGAGKTELVALAQQHHGPGLDARHLPGSWASSANSLEGLAFTAKDALFVVDDFAPGGSIHDVSRYHKEADRLIRAQGNRAGRGRCRPDGSVRPAKPPRGLILSTGEDVPRGQSVRGRLLILELAPGDLDWSKLTTAQADAAGGAYAKALSSYIRWLAPRITKVRRALPRKVAKLREELRTDGQHARTPGLIADLLLGVRYFLRFAVEAGAIPAEKKEALAARFKAALLAAGAEQVEHGQAAEPCANFLHLLAAVFTSGRGHLAPREVAQTGAYGADSAHLETYGWRAGAPQGRCVGWVGGDDLFLEPEAAFAAAQELAREQGESLAVQARTLWRRMREKNLLASWDQKRGHNLIRIRVGGARPNVVHLNAAALYTSKHRPHRPQGGKNPEKTGGRVGPITEKDPDYRPRASAPGCKRTVKTKAQTTNKPAAEEGVGPIGGADNRTKNKHRPQPAAKKGPKTSQKQQGGADGVNGADVSHSKEGQGSGVTFFT
jgi:hypothetical protein